MVPTRGSLRSRGAALVSALTLRQIRAVLPPGQAWELWLSRRIVAGIMGAFGPSLAAKAIAHVARFIDTPMRANGFDAMAGKAG